MNKRERAAISAAEYKSTDELIIGTSAEKVDGGFWVAALVWVSDTTVEDQLAEEAADHADAQRKAAKEAGL